MESGQRLPGPRPLQSLDPWAWLGQRPPWAELGEKRGALQRPAAHAWPQIAPQWPPREWEARIPTPRLPPPARKPSAACGSVTEKQPEPEIDVECLLLSASKILNSSEGVKESGGNGSGKTFPHPHSQTRPPEGSGVCLLWTPLPCIS